MYVEPAASVRARAFAMLAAADPVRDNRALACVFLPEDTITAMHDEVRPPPLRARSAPHHVMLNRLCPVSSNAGQVVCWEPAAAAVCGWTQCLLICGSADFSPDFFLCNVHNHEILGELAAATLWTCVYMGMQDTGGTSQHRQEHGPACLRPTPAPQMPLQSACMCDGAGRQAASVCGWRADQVPARGGASAPDGAGLAAAEDAAPARAGTRGRGAAAPGEGARHEAGDGPPHVRGPAMHSRCRRSALSWC